MADIRTPFKFFASLDAFKKTKVSANSTNTQYTLNDLEYEGEPYILYTDICFIGEKTDPKIWNRGVMYDCSPAGESCKELTEEDIKDILGGNWDTILDFLPEGEIGQILAKTEDGVEWESLKTINGESLVGDGNITINSSGDSGDILYLDNGLSSSVTQEEFTEIKNAIIANKTIILRTKNLEDNYYSNIIVTWANSDDDSLELTTDFCKYIIDPYTFEVNRVFIEHQERNYPLRIEYIAPGYMMEKDIYDEVIDAIKKNQQIVIISGDSNEDKILVNRTVLDEDKGFELHTTTGIYKVDTSRNVTFEELMEIPIEGEIGQALTKTDNGIEWSDVSCDELSKDDLEDIFNPLFGELNVPYIKCYVDGTHSFKYYTFDEYEEIYGETPIGISIRTNNLPRGVTVGLSPVSLLKWNDLTYDYSYDDYIDSEGNYLEDCWLDFKHIVVHHEDGYSFCNIPPEGYELNDYFKYTEIDYNGRKYTEEIIKLYELRNPDVDWKNATMLTSKDNSDLGGCACWRYFTKGTKQGDWYWPSTGEIYEVWKTVKKYKLNNIGDKLHSKFYGRLYIWFEAGANWQSSYGNDALFDGGMFSVTVSDTTIMVSTSSRSHLLYPFSSF